ncbi:MAG: hypothetical protein EOM90_12450 [Alphaproteobacteria bacterium]|nr:hypothetical protein [Alphaproteobacteria bacterium]
MTIRKKNIVKSCILTGLTVLLTLNGTLLHAQFEHRLFSSNLVFEGKIYYGFLYAQHLELEYYNAHFPSFEISIQQMTFGKHPWERAYNYPLIGLSLLYSTLGNNPSLGQGFAVMPHINFPLFKKKDFTLGFRFALGLGYITRSFDRLTNYKNLAVGSNFNAAVNLMLEARYRLNYYLTLTGGIGLQHFSNGALKLPNYGVNAIQINVGLAYRPFRENKEIDDRFYAPTGPYEAIIRRTIEFNIGGFLGYKNMEAVFGQNFLVYHLFENTFIPWGRKSKIGLGLDLSYDPSHIKILEMSDNPVDNKFKILRPGVNAAYQLAISKIACIVNLGVYLGGKEKSNGPLYEKLSLQYNFSKNFFASVMLKVHWGRADYIGWGLGYKFITKYGKKTIH